MKRLLLTLALLAQPIRAAPLAAIVDPLGAAYVADRCHVGLSIVVHTAGRTAFFDYGSVRRDRRERPTPDSVYELASVTKTFTGALAARALLDHRLTLDGDFRDALPEAYPNLTQDGHPITLRAIATHTSGLPRDLPDTDALMAEKDFEHIGARLAALNAGWDKAHDLAALHTVTLRSRPETAFAYSNLGMRVIGYGLEQRYHQPLSALLARFITSPLNMRETRFVPTAAMRARLVTPYSRAGNVQPYHDTSAGAAYGLYSTPRDMARYLAWQLDARDPVIARAHRLIRGDETDGAAMIWNVGRDGQAPMLWHGGGSFGETSQILLYPKSDEGYVLLANDACEGSESALKRIAMTIHAGLNGRK